MALKKVQKYSLSPTITQHNQYSKEKIASLQVTFNDKVQYKTLHTWVLAHHLARKSDWIHIVADRHRFQRRINDLESTFKLIFTDEHRNKIINKITENNDQN